MKSTYQSDEKSLENKIKKMFVFFGITGNKRLKFLDAMLVYFCFYIIGARLSEYFRKINAVLRS